MHAYFVLWPTFSNLACSHDPIAVNFTELRDLFLHFGTDWHRHVASPDIGFGTFAIIV